MKLPLILVLCLGLTGCSGLGQLPSAHEIEHMVPLETLGIDQQTVEVLVTAVSPGRGGTGDAAGQDPVTRAAQGRTIAAAQGDMQTQGSDFLFFGQVEQVVVGRTDLEEVLNYLSDDPQLRLESTLWAMKGTTANQALTVVPEVTNRLTALVDDGQRLGQVVSRSAREVYVELEEGGCSLIPALTLEDETVDCKGYALVAGNRVSGWVTGDAARGFTLLLGGGSGATVDVLDADGVPASLAVERVGVDVSLEGNRLTLSCQAQARLAQGQGGEDQLERLGWVLEDVLRDWLTAAVEVGQRDNRDYANLIGRSLTSRRVNLENLRVEVAAYGAVVTQ